jgi:hypothetical protein
MKKNKNKNKNKLAQPNTQVDNTSHSPRDKSLLHAKPFHKDCYTYKWVKDAYGYKYNELKGYKVYSHPSVGKKSIWGVPSRWVKESYALPELVYGRLKTVINQLLSTISVKKK